MKEVQITNGVVILKDFCSRKLKREITSALSKGAEIKSVGDKQEVSNITFEAMEIANDIALIGMTEKITINGEDKVPSREVYDAMSIQDVNKVLEEVNKLTNTKEDLNS